MAELVRLLHVDDEPDFPETTATFLEREIDGLAVETAPNAEAAGVESLEAVRDRYGDLPFLLFTGKGSEEVASAAISAGVTDYLQKGSGTEQYAILASRIENAHDSTGAPPRATADGDERGSGAVTVTVGETDIGFYVEDDGDGHPGGRARVGVRPRLLDLDRGDRVRSEHRSERRRGARLDGPRGRGCRRRRPVRVLGGLGVGGRTESAVGPGRPAARQPKFSTFADSLSPAAASMAAVARSRKSAKP